MCIFHGEDADCGCGRDRYDGNEILWGTYEPDEYDVMLQELREEPSKESPLLDWIIDHPEHYPRLCESIRFVGYEMEEIEKADRRRKEARPRGGFDSDIGEVSLEERNMGYYHLSCLNDQLLEIRDRAAEMLGYEERDVFDPSEVEEVFPEARYGLSENYYEEGGRR